jgi:UDP-2,3-diacylglucosamine pyrophosphatase LpxH
MAKKLMVISDLHIGAGVLDDCDAELERQLIRFFEYVDGQRDSVELVINGDFFDFAQAEPWAGKELESRTADGIPLCFSQEQSLAKLEQICNAHQPVMAALAELARSQKHEIVVMPGNHDVDFFWNAVRAEFLSKIGLDGKGSGLRFHLERHYRPPDHRHVWIEHGNQFDPINDFYVSAADRPSARQLRWGPDALPILLDVAGEPRLVECLGTRFLIRVINRLDEHYPYVDNVKPFSRMFRILRDSAFDSNGGSRKFGIAYWHIAQFLRDRMQSPEGRADLLDKPKDPATLGSWIAMATGSMSKRSKLVLTKRLIECGLHFTDTLEVELLKPEASERLMQTIIDHEEELLPLFEGGTDLLAIDSNEDEMLALAKGALPIVGFDETTALVRAAQALKSNDIRLVVFGHTHERVEMAGYINSGSWTRYWTDPRKAPRWSELKSDNGAKFPYELNFVEVTANKPDGVLVTFDGASTPPRRGR